MTKQQLKDAIDIDITNKTLVKSITPLNVGENLKKVLDFYENTDILPEGLVNLYFTVQRVVDIATPLIANSILGKEDKIKKGVADGYTPLNSSVKVPSIYLDIINDLTTGGTTNILSAEQGKLLQNQINGINVILSSDNINLDTVQEIVDAIENVQISLATILVNDLTTGGVTKALTAEMGKELNLLKQDISNLSQSILTDKLNTAKYPSTKEVYDFVKNELNTNLQKVIASDYTLTNADNNYSIIINNGANPLTITVPTGLLAILQVGFIQQGTGDVSFIASGTTLNTPTGLKIKGINYNAYIEKIGNTEVFQLLGNLKT